MLSTIPSRRHSSAIADSPRSPDNTIRIFSSAEYRLRVARRISRTCCSAVSDGTDFCLIFAPSRATMSQKSSLRKIPQSVSQLLTGNMRDRKLADVPLGFSEVLADLELIRMPLEKHELPKDRKLEAPLEMIRNPPHNDSTAIYVYDPKDNRRVHIMGFGVSTKQVP